MVIQSLPQTPWEKALQSPELAILVDNDWAAPASKDLLKAAQRIEVNEPFIDSVGNEPEDLFGS